VGGRSEVIGRKLAVKCLCQNTAHYFIIWMQCSGVELFSKTSVQLLQYTISIQCVLCPDKHERMSRASTQQVLTYEKKVMSFCM